MKSRHVIATLFDREFKSIKDSLTNLSLIQADKDTSNEAKKTMHFKAKNSEQYYEILFVEGEKYTISDLMKLVPECADLTNQRVSALVRQLIAEGSVERYEEKRKAYFRLIAE